MHYLTQSSQKSCGMGTTILPILQKQEPGKEGTQTSDTYRGCAEEIQPQMPLFFLLQGWVLSRQPLYSWSSAVAPVLKSQQWGTTGTNPTSLPKASADRGVHRGANTVLEIGTYVQKVKPFLSLGL